MPSDVSLTSTPSCLAQETADGGGAATTGTDQEKVQDKAAAGGEELVIRAPVHCDGCARKLRRSLQRIEGNMIVLLSKII